MEKRLKKIFAQIFIFELVLFILSTLAACGSEMTATSATLADQFLFFNEIKGQCILITHDNASVHVKAYHNDVDLYDSSDCTGFPLATLLVGRTESVSFQYGGKEHTASVQAYPNYLVQVTLN